MAISRKVGCGLGLGLVLIGLPLTCTKVREDQDHQALQAALRDARAAGFALSAEEFRATVPPARPEENAAPIYQKLRFSRRLKLPKVGFEEFVKTGGTVNLSAYDPILKQHSRLLRQLEAATDLPRCWFDRKWEDGDAVLYPELAQMKTGAKLLAFRGIRAAQRGDSTAAIRDFRRLLALARHVEEEDLSIQRFVGGHCREYSLRPLVTLALTHRDRPEYARALREAAEAYPPRDLAREMRFDLYGMLQAIDDLQTSEGRKKYGFKEQPPHPAHRLAGALISPIEARTKIVREYIAMRRATQVALGQRAAAYDAAHLRMRMARFVFPDAFSLHEALAGLNSIDEAAKTEAPRRAYLAISRVLSENPIPRRSDPKDLRSPIDGKPIRIRFDGKVLMADGGDGEPLRFPTR